MSGILVIFEQRSGRISRISWEALAAGQKLAEAQSLTITAANATLTNIAVSPANPSLAAGATQPCIVPRHGDRCAAPAPLPAWRPPPVERSAG